MSESSVLIYMVRRDLRVSDNPILHHLASSSDHGFTHLLPVFVLPPHQIEVSGLLKEGTTSPYPEARSEVGRFWRCGPHRVKFIAQSIWNMKDNLTKLGNDLTIRVGRHDEVLKDIVDGLGQNGHNVKAVWMIGEEGYEEERDQKTMARTCSKLDIDLRIWVDEKYFIDDRDLKLETSQDLPDVFTTYRKMMEPLRERPRATVPTPSEGALPKALEASEIPSQAEPFEIPSSLDSFEGALLRPVADALPKAVMVDDVKSAHPFRGGEDNVQDRLDYLINSGSALGYKSSRNGLLGTDFSTKLSAYLAQGCITARQVHEALVAYEGGKAEKFAEAKAYGEGENEGTKAIRFELLWRDYMRLCTRKFKNKLYYRSGFRDDQSNKWQTANVKEQTDYQKKSADEIAKIIQRVVEGSTGQSLIDASQRELIFTGYTSNRARQNVASFLAKHLDIDWRYGAEWYEMLLVDYDVSSNWSNWQYVAGVGNDPRGEARIFNPVKQAFDYDKEGEYVRCWVPELRKLENLENLFQPWTTPKEDWDRLGLTGIPMAEDPVKKIEFSVEGKPKSSRRPFVRRRGQGRGGPNGQPPQTPTAPQQPNGGQQMPYRQTPDYQPNDGLRNPRGGFRGGRGDRGGLRGRGYGGPGGYSGPGGPRGGGFRGGRGQGQWQVQQGWQPGYYPQQPRGPMPMWSQPGLGPAQ